MDRNFDAMQIIIIVVDVALRKESVDRNDTSSMDDFEPSTVALRKESVDRNPELYKALSHVRSLSARRAWIEILVFDC